MFACTEIIPAFRSSRFQRLTIPVGYGRNLGPHLKEGRQRGDLRSVCLLAHSRPTQRPPPQTRNNSSLLLPSESRIQKDLSETLSALSAKAPKLPNHGF